MRRRVHIWVVSLMVSSTLSLASYAAAATFHVDTEDDDPAKTACNDAIDHDCSLRGAITASNDAPADEGNTIVVPGGIYAVGAMGSCTYERANFPGPITSSQRPLCVTGKVTIDGEAANQVLIDGGQFGRVMYVSLNADVEIRGVTIRNGLSDTTFGFNPYGGGILNHGTLKLTEVVVGDNLLAPNATGAGGGGIYNQDGASLTLERCLVTRNGLATHEGGGGILNSLGANLKVVDSVITDNDVASLGGGIYNYGGTVTITGSAVVGNHAQTGLGGGIANLGALVDNVQYPGVLTIVDSTISENTSASSGGGIYNHFFTTVDLNNVTIANNDGAISGGDGGGLSTREDADVFIRNTIIAGNTSGAGTSDDCEARNTSVSAALQSQGYNLIANTTNCVLVGDTTGNITGQDPLLAPLSGSLEAAGLPTPAHAPLDGSPALDAGNPNPPGSGGTSCAAVDQRGFVRPQKGRCDIGAIEGRGGFALTGVAPRRGGNGGWVTISVFGSGISFPIVANQQTGKVELIRDGETPIEGDVLVTAGGDVAYATFDLDGAALGAWSVRVTNGDDSFRTLSDAFTIDPVRQPELWVDVIGHETPRVGPNRYYIAFGNRGNVDAFDVPVTFSVPFADVAIATSPPPPNPNGVGLPDWSSVPVPLRPAFTTGGVTNVPLLLPIVPASSSGVIETQVTLPGDVGGQGTFLLFASIDTPMLDPSTVKPSAEAVDGIVLAAVAYAHRVIEDLVFEPALLDSMKEYASVQLALAVAYARREQMMTAGAKPAVLSMSQLIADVALYGAVGADAPQSSTSLFGNAAELLARASDYAGVFAGPLYPTDASAQQNCPPARKGGVLAPGCSGGGGPTGYEPPPDIPIPPECDLTGVKSVGALFDKLQQLPNCGLPPDSCLALPGREIKTASDGRDYCVTKGCTFKQGLPSSAENGLCKPYPIRPVNSRDPNDKHGTIGATPEQFLVRGVTLNYTIDFENVATASAPAQEVVVTDQLDVASLDLATFHLGPMAFGNIVVTPAAGVTDYTSGVDLRPDQDLVVLIAASLDEETGVVTWRFTSVDPDTLEFPEDPLAGFLPPNANPPEGEGSVTFSIEQKPELASGTQICNDASIVFDVNEPIVTPQWCNTIDVTPPESAVADLDAGQAGPSFRVEWAGTDAHSGVGAYDVFVSVDGGPFTLWLDDTVKTSAVYVGEAGKTYAFYSVATDNVGNVEVAPDAADATTTPRGGCSQPVTTGAAPTASDCLFVLRTAVGSEDCAPECVCDPNGDSNTTATDALLCLKKAVGQGVTLGCECPVVTTTTTTTSSSTTSTTSPQTTSTIEATSASPG